MQNLVKRALLGVIGLVAVLGYWTLRGGGGDTPSQSSIPARVWEGGGGTLAIQIESSCAAKMSVSFSEREKKNARSLETWEPVGAGAHSWTIDVPRGAGGYIELGAEQPKVGDTLRWTISLNGRVIDEQSETLEQELKAGYAFFLQSWYEDYSEAKQEEG